MDARKPGGEDGIGSPTAVLSDDNTDDTPIHEGAEGSDGAGLSDAVPGGTRSRQVGHVWYDRERENVSVRIELADNSIAFV